MVSLLALLVAAGAEPQQPAEPGAAVEQARAVVRIVHAASLRFDEIEQSEPERLRESSVRSADGTVQPIRLVEYQ